MKITTDVPYTLSRIKFGKQEEIDILLTVQNELLKIYQSLPVRIREIIEYVSIKIDKRDYGRLVVEAKLSGGNLRSTEQKNEWTSPLPPAGLEISAQMVRFNFLQLLEHALRKQQEFAEDKCEIIKDLQKQVPNA